MKKPDIFELFNDDELIEWAAIKHWNKAPTINSPSIADHTFWVTFFSRLLCVNLQVSERITLMVMDLATTHDLDEMISGDLNSLFKHNRYNGGEICELTDAFIRKRITDGKFDYLSDGVKMFLNHMFLSYKNIGNDELDKKFVKLLVKCADYLALLHFTDKEVRLGNTFLLKQHRECIALAKSRFIALNLFLKEKELQIWDFFTPDGLSRDALKNLEGYIKHLKHLEHEFKNR